MLEYILWTSSIICGIAGILGIRHYLSLFKDRKVGDLWNEIINFTVRHSDESLVNNFYLNDKLTNNKERLRNIVDYSTKQLRSTNKKRDTLDKINTFKERARQLQKWYIVW